MNTEETNNVDLFENPELIPTEVKEILDKYEEQAINGFSYEEVANMLKEIQAVGYTFDYYLDAEPYNLRKM